MQNGSVFEIMLAFTANYTLQLLLIRDIYLRFEIRHVRFSPLAKSKNYRLT